MKYRIIKQVPGATQFELDRVEIECDTQEEAKAAGQQVKAWGEAKINALPPHVRDRLTTHPPQAAPARAAAPSFPPRSASPGAAGENHLGFPERAYHDFIDRMMDKCGLGGGQYDRQDLEANLLRAASVYYNKAREMKYSNSKSLPDMAKDYQSKGWKIIGVTKTWEKMLDMEKVLDADGRLELGVPLWDKGLGKAYTKQILYTAVGHAAGHPEVRAAAGLDRQEEEREPGSDDDSLPF